MQTKWAYFKNVRIWQESPHNPGSLEKFAELIIKECTEVINDGTNPSIFYQTLMLRHFGTNIKETNVDNASS
tara:strand:- start:200 stop:415 length:216 start_codon:yes stop_codon:yes gene_type:complete